MVVQPSEVQFRLSGGAANQNPFGSLGGVKSSEQMKDDMIDAFFDPISVTQRTSGHTDYLCFYIHNASGASQMSNCKIWFTVVPSFISMGKGTSAVNGLEQTIANDVTPPAGINFTQPLSEGSAIVIGNIPFGQHQAIWLRRIIPAGVLPTASVLVRFKAEADNA